MTAVKASTARVPWAKFVLYTVVAAVVVALATTVGRLFAGLYLTRDAAIGWGFLVFLSHLFLMMPVELLYLLSEQPRLVAKPRDLLAFSRTCNWTGAAIYGNAATWSSVAGIGLGLATIAQPLWTPYAGSGAVLVWHLLSKRAFCEHKHTPHLHQRPPYTLPEELCSWAADVPLLAIALWLAWFSGEYLWLLAFSLILSYTLLVRAGHWFKDYGPMSYVATVGGLVAGAFIVWPMGAFQPHLWKDPHGILGFVAGILSAKHTITKKVPRRERVVSGLFTLAFGSYTVYSWQTGANVDFARSRLLKPAEWDAPGILTMMAVFLLPFVGYVVIWGISEARDWMFPPYVGKQRAEKVSG